MARQSGTDRTSDQTSDPCIRRRSPGRHSECSTKRTFGCGINGGRMTSFEVFWRAKQNLIERRLRELVPSSDTEPRKLHESVHYSLFADAKRIRPVLALAVASLFRVEEDEMLDAACTLEMVHTSSLILDDLPCMDGATLRRGKAANHLVFGEDTAILAAFYLLNRAYGILSDYRKALFSPILATQFV